MFGSGAGIAAARFGDHLGLGRAGDQGGGVAEDVDLELPDRGAGIDAEFLGQVFAHRPQRRQRVGLTPEPVLGEREQPEQFLTRRMLRAFGRKQMGDLVGSAEFQRGRRAIFHGGQAQRVQARALGPGPRLRREGAEGITAPQRERGRQTPVSRGRIVIGLRRDQRVELPRVHPVFGQSQRVAGLLADQDPGRCARWPVRFEDPA